MLPIFAIMIGGAPALERSHWRGKRDAVPRKTDIEVVLDALLLIDLPDG
jgi:hypothetical protein